MPLQFHPERRRQWVHLRHWYVFRRGPLLSQGVYALASGQRKQGTTDLSYAFGAKAAQGAACVMCDPERKCDSRGSTRALSKARTGSIIVGEERLTIVPCERKEACVESLKARSLDNVCAEGYTGEVCSSCVSGYFRTLGFLCSECSKSTLTIVFGENPLFLAAFAFPFLCVLRECPHRIAGFLQLCWAPYWASALYWEFWRVWLCAAPTKRFQTAVCCRKSFCLPCKCSEFVPTSTSSGPTQHVDTWAR